MHHGDLQVPQHLETHLERPHDAAVFVPSPRAQVLEAIDAAPSEQESTCADLFWGCTLQKNENSYGKCTI